MLKPEKGYHGRMRGYLKEMYPVLPRLPMAALLYISFSSFLGRIHGTRTALLTVSTGVGVWSGFSLMLILRLMDELKDKDVDLRLFSHRPLPSGRVRESDLKLSLAITIAGFLIANLIVAPAFWMACLALGYAFLMFRYFFIPRILKRYLLLNLATHNPIIPIMLIYFVILFAATQDLKLTNLKWPEVLLLVAQCWAVFFAWEIARKIRSQKEENAYVTYSQILGRTGAVLLAGGAQTVAFIIGLHFFLEYRLSGIFAALLVAAYSATLWGYVRFLRKPSPLSSKLRPFAERYAIAVLAAYLLENLIPT